tara:strand:- start:4076 stop:4489 length:414 start_codon:yes stop_codon:yes gene_type:complete
VNITKPKLKQIIKEELTQLIEEERRTHGVLGTSLEPYEGREHVEKFFERYRMLLEPHKNNPNVLGHEIANMLLKLDVDYETLMQVQHKVWTDLKAAMALEPDNDEIEPEEDEPPIEAPNIVDTEVDIDNEEEDLLKP